MTLRHSPSAVAIAGHPIHAVFASFPTVCFTLTLLTDIAYWRTANLMWLNFSAWLLFAGLVVGAVAVVAGAADMVLRADMRRRRAAWLHVIGNVVVLCVAFVNSLVHARDGWTAVVPTGLILSAVTVLLLIVTAWFEIGRA